MCRRGTWNIRDAYGVIRGMHRRNFQDSLDWLLDGIHEAVGGKNYSKRWTEEGQHFFLTEEGL